MEGKYSENGGEEINQQSPQATAQVNTQGNSRNQTRASQNKQWSLSRHWQQAPNSKRLKWVAEGFGILIAVLMLFNYVWGNILTKSNFETDQRPYVSVVQGTPVELRVANASFGTFLATMLPIKNTGKSPAIHVLVASDILSGAELEAQVPAWYTRMGMPLKTHYDKGRNMYALENGVEVSEKTLLLGDPAVAGAMDMTDMLGRLPIPSLPVAVVMRIQYRDNASNPYWTDLCYYVSVPIGGGSQVWAPCPGYPLMHDKNN